MVAFEKNGKGPKPPKYDSVSAEKESERKREIKFNGQSGELWEESTEQFLRKRGGG